MGVLMNRENWLKNIEGAVFDLDGTLLDSSWVWEKVDEKFLGDRGFQVPDEQVDEISPLGAERAAVYTIERFGLNEDKDDIVRENVAENPKTGSLTLEEMAEHDAVIDVKLAALGNPNIPTRVIHRMAAGTGKRVRETIAGNISTPKTILMKSARDRDTNVAYNVACNPNVPREALTILAERRNIGILVVEGSERS